MHTFRAILSAAAAASLAMAETRVVAVGQNGLTFEPQMVTAAVGDTVEFHFWPQNHSVVAGDANSGCSPLSGGQGFFSGFMPVASGMGDMVFQVEVSDTNPVVFYCSQGRHCQNGMFGMINGDDSLLSSYTTLAQAASNNASPDSATAFGGTVTAMSDSDDQPTGDDSNENDSGAGMVAASVGMSFAAFAAAILLI